MYPKLIHYVKNLDYEKFIRSKPCLICNRIPVDLHHMYHHRGSSYIVVPLCREHHTISTTSYHHLEKDGFEMAHNINLEWEMINLLSAFIHLKAGLPEKEKQPIF